jgi:hypothetical protein
MERMDFLWQDIEPEPGKFDFAKYDRIVELTEREGIELLGLLDYSTCWDSPTGEWNVPSEDTAAFVNFCVKVVERYKGRVKHWEVWNEPDFATYWKNQDSLKTYCRMLRQVYAAVKKADPSCMVLNGGLTYNLASVNNLYENGGIGCFDALNIHIFENPRYPAPEKKIDAYIKAVRRIMERHGNGDKAIWVTEIGCPGVRKEDGARPCWMGENPGEQLQAEWVAKVYRTLLANPGVKKVFWAFFRDTQEHFNDGVDHFGLVRNDLSAKPAYREYKKAHSAWLRQGKH